MMRLDRPPVDIGPVLHEGELAAQARVQADQAAATHQAQIQQQKAQNDAIHLQIKAQAEIELARVKANLDAKMALLDAHLKAATEARKGAAQAGGLRQGIVGLHVNSLWSDGMQDCFEAVGTYQIDQGGVALLFTTGLGGELNRFFIERVDVDADHSTLFLSRGSCRVAFTISAAISREGSWVPLPIAPFK